MNRRILRISFALSLAIVLLLTLAACGASSPLTMEEFTEIIKKEGYTITNDAPGRYNDGVLTAVQATGPGVEFAIEFYVFSSIDKAKETSRAIDKNLNARAGTKVRTSGKYFRLTSKGMFYFASRADSTLVYVETEDSNKDAVSEILKTLGYW